MRQKAVFIHVGLPKTASTLLQEVVFPELRNVTYISRPYTQENHVFNKLQYADDTLYAAEELDRELNAIFNLQSTKTILISDELFSGAPFYNFLNRSLIAKRLAALLPFAQIILFLRGQRDIIRSLHNQYVKIGWFSHALDSSFISLPGKGFELSDFVNGTRNWNIHNRFINHRSFMNQYHFLFYELVRLYDENFSNVHVFLYEDLLMQPQVVLSRFEELFDTKFPDRVLETIKATSLNPKLSQEQLMAQLIRNRLRLVHHGGAHKVARRALIRFLRFTMKDYRVLEKGENYLAKIVAPELLSQNNGKLLKKYPEIGINRYPESYFLNKRTDQEDEAQSSMPIIE